MKALYVYADFDWLDEPVKVGELGYESLRGSDSYSFRSNLDSSHRRLCLEVNDLSDFLAAVKKPHPQH